MTNEVNFSLHNLAKAGEGSTFPNHSKLLNELAGSVFEENKFEKTYDLLDDETGLVSGSFKDFLNAAQLESMNALMDENYHKKITYNGDLNKDKTISYYYDSDENGIYETQVYFGGEDVDSMKLFAHSSFIDGEGTRETATLWCGDLKYEDGRPGVYIEEKANTTSRNFNINEQPFTITYDDNGNPELIKPENW